MFGVIVFLVVSCLIHAVEGDSEGGLTSRRHEFPGSVVDTCNSLKEEAQEIRREGYSAVQKADQIRDQAYRVKEEAFELKEEAYEIKVSALEARSALEVTLVETLALMKSQATVTGLYIQEIRSSLSSLSARLESLEQEVGDKFGAMDTMIAAQSNVMEEKLAAQRTAIEENLGALNSKVADQKAVLEKLEEQVVSGTAEVVAKVSETQTTVSTIKYRQQNWMSEIRLISLYKMTEENNRHGQGFDSDLVTDGEFLHSSTTDVNMRTYSSTGSAAQNNKLWIKLGGIFRIHKIKIWNIRHCCRESKLKFQHLFFETDDKPGS
ncbi:hypothetical protein ACHWQZ_G014881 [Mnemiopsis leidyi]